MTFLELCKAAARESGAIQGVQPITVVNQSGRLGKLVDWVIQSWVDIQNERNAWKFMRKEFSFQTIANIQRYAPASVDITNLAVWITEADNTTIYKTADGVAHEGVIPYVEWSVFRHRWLRGEQTNNHPTEWTIDNDNKICFGARPDAPYTVNGEYMRSAQVLVEPGDVPICPARFHMAIAWRAVMKMHGHDEGSEAWKNAALNYAPLWDALQADQLPSISISGSTLA